MLHSIKLIYERLLNEVDTRFNRFLYHTFNLDDRLTGILGPRGVGKTTLMLQYIKMHPNLAKQAFYFSADHIYFQETTLYSFIEELHLTEGKTLFFIDEIHKYKSWNQELKNIYDSFPKLKLVFSGSSSLDLVRGSHDLSRRAKMHFLPGMSFREYLNYETGTEIEPIPLASMIKEAQHYNHLATTPAIKGYFQDYLKQGFYPFYKDNPESYYEKLLRVIDKTIYEDITTFYNLKTANIQYFRKILMFVASIEPGTINTHNIANSLSADDKTINEYLHILQETGLVRLIHSTGGGNKRLRKAEKIFLDNTNLFYALQNQLASSASIGTVSELFFLQALKNSGKEIFYSKIGDYEIDGRIFEIGGKNKKRKQIKTEQNAILVKDDILVASNKVIPLFFFGFLY